MELKTQQITELRINTKDAEDLRTALEEFFASLEAGNLEDEDSYFLYGTTLTTGKKESELTLIVDLDFIIQEDEAE